MRASGTFEVKLNSLEPSNAEGIPGRMAIDKIFSRDLNAHSLGEMIHVGGNQKGSAAYSAIERVRGKLHGRNGSFVLQHTGIMNRGNASLVIGVVPDSGTEELVGLTGTMHIEILEKKHFYKFDYELNP